MIKLYIHKLIWCVYINIRIGISYCFQYLCIKHHLLHKKIQRLPCFLPTPWSTAPIPPSTAPLAGPSPSPADCSSRNNETTRQERKKVCKNKNISKTTKNHLWHYYISLLHPLIPLEAPPPSQDQQRPIRPSALPAPHVAAAEAAPSTEQLDEGVVDGRVGDVARGEAGAGDEDFALLYNKLSKQGKMLN